MTDLRQMLKDSLRKERLAMAAFDASQPPLFLGINVMVSADHPKMRLSEEVIPGVPWPPGFKAEMDDWMLRFFGATNLVADGEIWSIGKHTIYVNPRTYARIKRYVESAPTL